MVYLVGLTLAIPGESDIVSLRSMQGVFDAVFSSATGTHRWLFWMMSLPSAEAQCFMCLEVSSRQ